ncbi:MAG: hypothetical protein K5922_02220, partial [Clostridiales bacterium]|nr:hypothetical protein [Clostridiales bacterium]
MKRRMLWIVISMMAAFVLPSAGGYAGEVAGKKLTLMIYMCGSNLESSYGSASLDIQEMLGAELNSRELNVLVMTGGSDVPEDAGFFSRSAAEIYEIGPGRIRRVWQSEEPLNMGRQDTLERLLQFGVTNRPAERYALILWDHGGGPLEGVCWDETHEMDHLSLKEVTGALKSILKEDRLSWIGFDACLMGSLEVAGQLAPFAEYMIASQETEPASGWNYSFLRELHLDSDGAQTGRRIVDAYFEGQEQSREILTLACIDLHAAEEAITALDPVFVPLERRLGKEEFKELSGLRMSSVGFGKADPTVLESGYDLVDARDLVSRMEQTEASENLLRLLDRAVVYSRASEEGACGLSLYHPYVNKTGYTDKWKDEYQAFSF